MQSPKEGDSIGNFQNDCSLLYAGLTAKLQETEMNMPDVLQCSDTSVNFCYQYLQLLKSLVQQHQFADTAEEARFFKTVKPLFTSQLLYYKRIYFLHGGFISLIERDRKDYVELELQKVQQFLEVSREFSIYYKAGYTHLDEQCFTRRPFDWKLRSDNLLYEGDPLFTTCYDYKVAEILAYERLRNYLLQWQQELAIVPDENAPLTWTESKRALHEVIYGFYVMGVYNNGKANLREIALHLAKANNITITEIYHGCMELRMRKKDPIKFLHAMCAAILKHMDEPDQLHFPFK